MKKILIISYYYPPNNNIPSWRPFSWANYFSGEEFGNAEVHVVTRYWDGSEIKWEDQVNSSKQQRDHIHHYSPHHIVHYLSTHAGLKKTIRLTNRSVLLNKAVYFFSTLLGHHHIEVDTYFSFRKYIRKTFPKDYFDTVLVTSPPLNVVRLGYRLKRHFPSAFFVADFRDLWNNDELKINYSPGLKAKFYNSIYKRSISRWLKRYNLVTGVSLEVVKKTTALNKKLPFEVITNGFETELLKDDTKEQLPAFTIASIGSIYPIQNVRVLAEGIIDFARQNNFNNNIHVKFIGAKATNGELSNAFSGRLPEEMLAITHRVDRRDALKLLKSANVLIYPVCVGYRGIYSGKMFEYLASGNNILIAPGDNDVLDDLLKETRAGISKNSREEVTLQLQQWYDEWKLKGFVTYKGLPDKISFAIVSLLTHHLSTYDYGIINLYSSFLILLMPFITGGILYPLSVEYFKRPRETYAAWFTNAQVIPLLSLVLFTGLCIGFQNPLSQLLKVPVIWIWIMPVTAWWIMINETAMIITRNNNRPWQFVFFSVGKNLVEISLTIILVIGLHWTWQGRLLSAAAAPVLLGGVSIYLFYRWRLVAKKVNWKAAQRILLLSFPFVFERLAVFVMGYSDKFFIDRFDLNGTKEVGLYGLGNQLATIIYLVVVSMNSAYQPYLFQKLAEGHHGKIHRTTGWYIGACAITVVGMFIVIPFLFRFFIGSDFQEAKPYAYMLCSGFFMWGIFNAFQAYLIYLEKSRIILYISLLGMTASHCYLFSDGANQFSFST